MSNPLGNPKANSRVKSTTVSHCTPDWVLITQTWERQDGTSDLVTTPVPREHLDKLISDLSLLR